MSNQPASIRPLSTAASTAVRAGQVIGSFSRAVEELARNAASASAGLIVVTVGASSSSSTPYLQVSDDGIGIDPESLRQYVGIEPCSSRRASDGGGSQSIGLFAERGESLRSIAALSMEMRLSTSTRASSNATHRPGHRGDKKRRVGNTEQIVSCEKVIRESEVVSFRSSIHQAQLSGSSILPSSIGLSSRSTSSRQNFIRNPEQTGTTVTILGLFHRYAVRRKRHDIEAKKGDTVASRTADRLSGGAAQLSSSSSDRADLAQARVCLRSMALAYPLISFRLINGKTSAVDSSWEAPTPSISTHISTPRFDPSLPMSASFRGRRPGSQGTPTDANIITSSLSRRLVQLCGDAASNPTTIACLYEEDESLLGGGGKNAWAVIGALSFNATAVGVDPLDTSNDSGGKRINRTRQHELIFINNRPAKHISSLADIVQGELSTFLPPSSDNAAYFVLHVTCSARHVDLIIDENKSTLAVPQRVRMERLLRKAVSSSLQNNGFSRMVAGSRRAVEDISTLQNYRSRKINKPFDNHSDMIAYSVGSVASSKLICGEVVAGPGNHNADSSLPTSPYFSKGDTSNGNDDKGESSSKKAEATTSPFSDAFLGISLALPSAPSSASAGEGSSADDQRLDEETVSNEAYGRPSEANWTRTRLRAFESQISSLAVSLGANATAAGGTSSSRHLLAPISLSKEMLASAQVIAQVAEKFIIINAGDGLLCCVDQHAADERIGLERLERRLLAEMAESTTGQSKHLQGNNGGEKLLKSVSLLPAQNTPLSQSLLSVVFQHKVLLEKWRFSFKLPSAGNPNLLLTGVPGVCDKVATRQDFNQFLQALESRTSDAALIKPAFVKRVLASRACRYAIMFGDALSQERCEELIRELSECELCFVCAHGRPSVVPLLDMRTLPE